MSQHAPVPVARIVCKKCEAHRTYRDMKPEESSEFDLRADLFFSNKGWRKFDGVWRCPDHVYHSDW